MTVEELIEKLKKFANMEKAYIFDLDGTIFDISHRLHYIQQKPKNWSAFNNASIKDTFLKPGITILKALAKSGIKIIFVSGRPEDQLDIISEKFKFMRDDLKFADYYLRPVNDFRTDVELKEDILNILRKKYDIICAFDDRTRVVQMYRKNGIPCYQVAEGNF